jgi:hypothetical protein
LLSDDVEAIVLFLNFSTIGVEGCLSTWRFTLLKFWCQLLQDATLNLRCLSIKYDKSLLKTEEEEEKNEELKKYKFQ